MILQRRRGREGERNRREEAAPAHSMVEGGVGVGVGGGRGSWSGLVWSGPMVPRFYNETSYWGTDCSLTSN